MSPEPNIRTLIIDGVDISATADQTILEAAGFTNITIGDAIDTFGQSSGEGNARTFEVFGYSFLARRL